jgi:hypothetical protein
MRRGVMAQVAALRPEPLGAGPLLVSANCFGEKPGFVAVSGTDDLPGTEGQFGVAASHRKGTLAARRHVVQFAQRILQPCQNYS